MSSSERAELVDIIERAFDSLGGRADMAEMFAEIGELPPHLNDYLSRRGLKSLVGGFFRQRRDNGLPQAPEVDVNGTHAQLELWTVEECRYLVAQYTAGAFAYRAKAQKVVAYCADRYGVVIDIENPFVVARDAAS